MSQSWDDGVISDFKSIPELFAALIVLDFSHLGQSCDIPHALLAGFMEVIFEEMLDLNQTGQQWMLHWLLSFLALYRVQFCAQQCKGQVPEVEYM